MIVIVGKLEKLGDYLLRRLFVKHESQRKSFPNVQEALSKKPTLNRLSYGTASTDPTPIKPPSRFHKIFLQNPLSCDDLGLYSGNIRFKSWQD
jgi:hypothetical protein